MTRFIPDIPTSHQAPTTTNYSPGRGYNIDLTQDRFMDSLRQPTFLFYLFLAIFLALLGWGGLAALLIYSLPTLGPRWLFFFLTVLALSGSFLPATYFLNRRFPSDPPAEPIVILRQALWVGVYGAGLVWLQLGRMLNSTVAVVLALVLLIVEVLLRMRERSRWRPKV